MEKLRQTDKEQVESATKKINVNTSFVSLIYSTKRKNICVHIANREQSRFPDAVTFEMTLNKAGLQHHEKIIDKQTYGGPSGVLVQANSDSDLTSATVSLLTVSTQLFGNLPVPSPNGQLQTDTTHQITIQH